MFGSRDEVYFNITRSSQLKTAMIVSCDRLSLKLNDIDFWFEGRRVCPEETPDQLKMKNGDVIDALPGQQEGVLNLHDDNQPTGPSVLINIKVCNNRRFCLFDSFALLLVLSIYFYLVRIHMELGMEDGAEIDACWNLPYCDCCPRVS
ncbi:hypothetical protein M0R45_015374 [Rubus argutus]|uniref:Rad60/SUMO-like domain-containing protein n=1 Tax=Rubus argutus TaxID=59490 RepID=A0AAW1XPX7_RUBAR